MKINKLNIQKRKAKTKVKSSITPKANAKVSTKSQIRKAVEKGNKKIKVSLGDKGSLMLENIVKAFKQGKDSKTMYSKNGSYIPSRKKLHTKIINKILKSDTTTKKPDLYVLGGVAASGKTTALKKFIKENALTVNNDDIKEELAKVTPSPSKRFFLLHATLLHRESGDIESALIKKLLTQKKDIILDRTLSNYSKNLKLIKKFQAKGYEITTYGTNLRPHVAIGRATKRFLSKGRYVPLDVIASKGNQINKNVLKMAKRKFNKKSLVVDTIKRTPKVIFSKK